MKYDEYKEYTQMRYLITKLQQYHILVWSTISDDSDMF